MRKPDELAKGVYRVSADIETVDLFEGMWPIPHGVMLNAYVLKGERKNVLVDLVKDWDGACDAVEEQMRELGLAVKDIDVLVVNHMEPDHTGSLASFVAKNPEVEIYCTDKAVPLMKAFYGVSSRIHPVQDGETLDIGGRTLRFFLTPNVHWPETMMTYVVEDGILCSCDAFGAYGAYAHCFHDELDGQELALLATETERYYANIVAPFSAFVLRAIKKLTDAKVPLSIIAPSHGVVWRKDAMEVVAWYQRLATYQNGPREKEVTLVWSSMYGNTASLVPVIRKAVEDAGVKLHELRIPQTHVSYVLEKTWRSSAVIFGMPTYSYKMFPPMYDVLDEMERSRITGRKTMRFGSFGWSGGAQKQFDEFAERLKFDHMGDVEFQGRPTEEDERKAYDLAHRLALAVKG